MSAIFGIVRFDGAPVLDRPLQRMGSTLAHRGPHGRDFAVRGSAGLGHCLMRVNVEDVFEAQPIVDVSSGVTLVADCRIDNREELSVALNIGSDDLRRLPDSALILQSYIRWGEQCCEHLIGDFAFAIWDERKRKLFAARDHMGQRSFFYHVATNFVAFATEIKALWSVPNVPRELSEAEIGRYLMVAPEGRPEGETLFKGIHGLTGGMSLSVGLDGEARTRRYWEPSAVACYENRDEQYYVREYRNILTEAVACRFRRLIGSPGIQFSGGFDTSAIAGLAGPSLHGKKIFGFSAVVDEDHVGTAWDIRPWVEACRRVMPHLEVRYVVERNDPPLLGLEETFAIADGPGPYRNALNHWTFVEAARSGVALIVDGIGGDYTINPRGEGALARLFKHGRIGEIFRELGPHMRMTHQTPWRMLMSSVLFPLLTRTLSQRLKKIRGHPFFDRTLLPLTSDFVERLRREGVGAHAPLRDEMPRTAMRAAITSLARSIAATSGAVTQIRAAAHQLEFSRPFHDKRVVEFGLSVPEDLYVRHGRNRYLACTALADVYPPEFQTRSRLNDLPSPDFIAHVDSNMPEILDLVNRMAEMGKIREYVDFSKVAALLMSNRSDRRAKVRIAMALHTIRVAYYVAWFSRLN